MGIDEVKLCMKTRKINLEEADKDMVIDSFLKAFDNETKEEIFSIDLDFSQDGFSALEDFYKEFNKEVEEKEKALQKNLCKGVITLNELEDLENIALVKYKGIKLEEISNFYLFSNREEREKLVLCLSSELV